MPRLDLLARLQPANGSERVPELFPGRASFDGQWLEQRTTPNGQRVTVEACGG